MGTKVVKVVNYRERLPPLKLHDPLITSPTWGHATYWQNYVFQLGRVRLQEGGSERKCLRRYWLLVPFNPVKRNRPRINLNSSRNSSPVQSSYDESRKVYGKDAKNSTLAITSVISIPLNNFWISRQFNFGVSLVTTFCGILISPFDQNIIICDILVLRQWWKMIFLCEWVSNISGISGKVGA